MSEAVAPWTVTALPGAVRLLSDQRLVALGKRGDRAALNTICRRYQQDLFRYCEAILGSSEDAKDAVQNALVSAVLALPGERRKIELKPWLYRIAHNEAISVIRRRRDDAELDLDLAVPAVHGISEVQAREDLRQLVADLDSLSDRQRGALVMRELSGMSFDDIASTFQTSAGAVRQTIYEARLALHELKQGREMECERVKQAISAGDRRLLRGRPIRAHLHDCADCRAFDAAIPRRRADLAALAPPLPALALAGMLQSVVGGGAAAGGSAAGAGASGVAAAAAAKSTAGALAVKSAAALAVVAAAAGTADVIGVVDGPIGGGSGDGGAEVRNDGAPSSEAAGGAESSSGGAAGGAAGNDAARAGRDGGASRSNGNGPAERSKAGGNSPSHSNAGPNSPSRSSAGGNAPSNSSPGGNSPSHSNAGGNPPPNSSAGGNPPPTSSAGGNPPPTSSAGGNSPSGSSAGGNPPPNSSGAGKPAPSSSGDSSATAPPPATEPAPPVPSTGAPATAPGQNKIIVAP